VIAIAQTIVDEHTVVVKFLNAPVAEVTVVRLFGSQRLAGDADVVQVVVALNELDQKLGEVRLRWNVAGVYHTQTVEYDCAEEEKGLKPVSDLVTDVVLVLRAFEVVNPNKDNYAHDEQIEDE
jgi:hypothetical protein